MFLLLEERSVFEEVEVHMLAKGAAIQVKEAHLVAVEAHTVVREAHTIVIEVHSAATEVHDQILHRGEQHHPPVPDQLFLQEVLHPS
jgi:hypothetical protein